MKNNHFRLIISISILISLCAILVFDVFTFKYHYSVSAELPPGPIITTSCKQSGGYCTYPFEIEDEDFKCFDIGGVFEDCKKPVLPLTNPLSFEYGTCCKIIPQFPSTELPEGTHTECKYRKCTIVANPDDQSHPNQCLNDLECSEGGGMFPSEPGPGDPPIENGHCVLLEGKAGFCSGEEGVDGPSCNYDYQCPATPVKDGHCIFVTYKDGSQGGFCSGISGNENSEPCKYDTECKPPLPPQPPPPPTF